MLFGLEGLYLENVGLIYCSVVQFYIVIKNLRYRGLFENRLPGALRFACSTVNTFVRMYVKHVREILVVIADIFVNAIDRTDADASSIDTIDAKPGYRPWHKSKSSLFSSLPWSLSR